MKKYNKGFTLIELLVVIAIIGILASVVLVSLGSARSKGKIASAVESMSSMRAAAELVNDNGNYPTDLCTNALLDLVTAVKTQAGADNVDCPTNTVSEWAASVDLTASLNASGDSSFFCVDSSGYAGYLETDPSITTDNLSCK